MSAEEATVSPAEPQVPVGPTPEVLLARRYRRWLLAYPAGYRRSRGDELVGTLLDLAEPGRTRPHPLDILDLLRAGLGRRLRLLLHELLVPQRRRGNGQIMAVAAFGLGCVVPVAVLAAVLGNGPGRGTWPEAFAQLPITIALVPVVAWLGVTATTRLRRAVVAGLMTAGCVLEPAMAGVWGNLAVAEWLAVLWFRPVPVEPAFSWAEDADERTEG